MLSFSSVAHPTPLMFAACSMDSKWCRFVRFFTGPSVVFLFSLRYPPPRRCRTPTTLTVEGLNELVEAQDKEGEGDDDMGDLLKIDDGDGEEEGGEEEEEEAAEEDEDEEADEVELLGEFLLEGEVR